jgi:hypothetical protein
MEAILYYLILAYVGVVALIAFIVLTVDLEERVKAEADAIQLKFFSGEIYGDFGESKTPTAAKGKMDELLEMRFPISIYTERIERNELRTVLKFAQQVRRANRGRRSQTGNQGPENDRQ